MPKVVKGKLNSFLRGVKGNKNVLSVQGVGTYRHAWKSADNGK